MYGGHTAEVEFLISKGADINLKCGFEGATALHLAASIGHTEIVRMLLDKGADITIRRERGGTALHWATAHKDIVETMLAKGADVNARGCFNLTWNWRKGAKKFDEGNTPLHHACKSGRAAVVELLIAHGADVNAKTQNGKTPMSMAEERGHGQIVELLHKHGAKEW